MEIGSIIKKCRNVKNITQEQLADKLNVSVQTVSRWENGVNFPDITLLPLISEYFGVSVDYLLGVKSRKTSVKLIRTKEVFSAETMDDLEGFMEKHKKERGTSKTVYDISEKCGKFYLEIETEVDRYVHELSFRSRPKRY